MKVYQTKDLRNITLLGGGKSGKTTLSECMLFEGGVINRRGSVDDKNTVSDYREIELERQNSISSTVMYTEAAGKKINFIDAPGFDDFIGEAVAALKVTDTVIMLINSQNGIEVGTEIHWKLAKKHNKPLIFAANQLEMEKSNFEETVRQLKSEFGGGVTVFQYPVNAGVGFNSVIDVIKMKMYKFSKDGETEILDIPESEKAKAGDMQAALIEAAAENDEALMEEFFEKGTLTEAEVLKGLSLGLVNRGMFPVMCVTTKYNFGVKRFMEFIIEMAPSPADVAPSKDKEGEDVLCDASGKLGLFVFKSVVEANLGEMNFFKVMRGELPEGSDLINVNTNTKERLTQIYAIAGKNREKVEKFVAGDIGAAIKLKNTLTNTTLCLPKEEMEFAPIVFPNPKFRVAVKAIDSGDDEKLGGVLYDISKVDQTIKVGYSKELRQLILEGQGELHLNAVKWHLEVLEKIKIEYYAPKIPYRETITKSAKADYRHKKQSGGSGQFGEVYMLIEPYTENYTKPSDYSVRGQEIIELPWGGKLVYNNCIVGGAIDARFLPAILKGVMEKIEQGPLTGSYARDIAVSVYDGKMHPVDSNEISFKLAGRHAFSEAFKNAGPKILEPIYDVIITVPEDKMGDVMTDLQGRRAIIMGMGAEGKNQVIKAKVPLAEMNKYSTALSSVTGGRATYEMDYAEYQQVPMDVQTELLKKYEEEQSDED